MQGLAQRHAERGLSLEPRQQSHAILHEHTHEAGLAPHAGIRGRASLNTAVAGGAS